MDASSTLQNLLIAFGVVALLATITAALIIWWLYGRLKVLRIARDAELGETLRKVPLLLVVALDLLDMSLDVFSAPFVWLLLDRVGLKKLRNLATAAAVIPGTQILPLLTISWFLARLGGRRKSRAMQSNRPKTEDTSGGEPQ
jgi:hypothetical protein